MKMKRNRIVMLSLAGMSLILNQGCNKVEESQGASRESTNVLVYEDASLKEQVSSYFYDNHIYRIELLGANREREEIFRAALAEGAEEGFLNLEGAQKFFFNHTDVIMYSIPTLDPEQTLILYESHGLYQVSMAHFRPVEGGLMKFTLKTMDDRDYFSLKLDEQNRMGDLRIFENEKIKGFNKAVNSLTLKEESQDEQLKGASAICCRKESSWSECMECTVDDCSGSWVCKVVAMIAPAELVAGFAASCIGAGPDARC
jgi:hypothetical protein